MLFRDGDGHGRHDLHHDDHGGRKLCVNGLLNHGGDHGSENLRLLKQTI